MWNARNFLNVSKSARTVNLRFNSTVGNDASKDLRARLLAGVKDAMKAKDTVTSTTLRSVLAEVYAADKTAGTLIPSSTIANILRKAVTKRQDSALQFSQASRPDLAEKETNEIAIVSRFLPSLLTEAEIEQALKEAFENLPEGSDPRKSRGILFKEFYAKVDKSRVDPKLVNDRATVLLSGSNQAK